MNKQLKVLVLCVLAMGLILGLATTGLAASPKDTVKVSLWTRVGSLDPYNNAGLADIFVADQIFDNLFIMDEKTRKPMPNLALSYKLINDTTWEFELRKGVKFSNGEPFNAAAVKYSFERVIDPKRKLYDMPNWKFLDHVEIVNEYMIRVVTKNPYPILLEKLAYDAFIYPPKYTEEKGDNYVNLNPIGTGPYRLVEWKQGEDIALEYQKNYWGKEPAIKKIIFRTIPEDAVSTGELITGGVDVVLALKPDQVPTVEKSKTAVLLTSPSNTVHFIQFDGDGRAGPTPFQKLEVRRAAYHAIDREAILKNVKLGLGCVLHGPLHPLYYQYDPSVKDIEPEYNPEKAKKLLAEAGYPNGFTAEIWAYINKEQVEAVQGYLSKVGIETKFNWYGADEGALIKLRNSGKVKDMGVYSWATNISDAEYYLPYWLSYGNDRNYNNDKEVGDWLVEAGKTMDQKKRLELYKKIQFRVVERAYWIPLVGDVAVVGVNKDLNLFLVGEFARFWLSSWK